MRHSAPMDIENLPTLLAEAIKAKGYETLTPVQASVVAPEAEGRDLLVSAQTGSGKTVAFGLAMAPQMLGEDGRTARAGAPLALAIAPTRELALQVSRELSWLYAKTGARIATCVGGMDASKERRALAAGTHIVVGTPGRLRDHLERGALQLGQLKVAILDEADEMLDMGFREDLEQILDATPGERRTFMFSATLPKPIVALARRYQKDAFRISTVGEDRGHGDIAYQAVVVAPADIENAVVNLLRFHEAPTAMLFCATRDNVRRLHASLIERGFDAVALSGEHTQSERNAALQALRDRRARVCVATDVAARGIDLPTLSLVVHVELPRDAETLQHRSGRTGRAGKKGTAMLVVPYPARRRVEGMLRGARIQAEWMKVPGLDEIRKQDRERLISALMETPVEFDDEDRALAARLLAERSPEDIAAMLVRTHRAKMPAAEEMLDNGPAPRAGRPERPGTRIGNDAGPRDGGGGDVDVVWFKMDVGRQQNADPRWILPLLCRRGHVTKGDVGTIKIGPNETRFEIPRAIAGKFMDALKRTEGADRSPEGGIQIIPADGAPPPRPARPRLEARGPSGPRAHPGATVRPMGRPVGHSGGPPKGKRPQR
jgi:ATP-dependent RNA helicase DeaD